MGEKRGMYTGSWLDLCSFKQLETLECFYELVKEGNLLKILPKSLRRLALHDDDFEPNDILLGQLDYQESAFRLLAEAKEE